MSAYVNRTRPRVPTELIVPMSAKSTPRARGGLCLAAGICPGWVEAWWQWDKRARGIPGFSVVQAFGHQILNVIMCFLQIFADFLSFVVNFWPGDDFLGGSSAETSIFPYNFLERQSCQDPYLSIRISRRVYQA